MAKRLTTIKKEVEANVESWIASQTKYYEEYNLKVEGYDYNVKIEDDRVQVCFDGGMIFDTINEHLVSVENDYWESYFCDETASKIFGLDKYSDWQEYASWRLDIFEG